LNPNFFPVPPDMVAVPTINAAKLRLTYSAPVVLNGLPIGITRQAAGAGPELVLTAAVQVSPVIIDITYAAALVATDVVTIPAGVAQIRGQAGGYTFPLVHTF